MKKLLLLGLLSTVTTKAQIFTPGGGATDVDGNTYTSIVLGNQEWMVENLRTTKYSNGNAIADGTGVGNICSGNTPVKYWFNYMDASTTWPTGKLYTWWVASDTRNVCPTGWHVPNDTAWSELATYLGGTNTAGGQMKKVGAITTSYWLSPNTGATNASGWTGMGGGVRSCTGSFSDMYYTGYWWSSTFYTTVANYKDLSYNGNFLNYNSGNKDQAMSIRCIKNSVNAIEDLYHIRGHTVSPNPATDNITITRSNNVQESFTLTDELGRIVLSGELIQVSTTLDIHALAKGFYTLRIIGGIPTSCKVVKN